MTAGSPPASPESRDDVVQILLGVIGTLATRIDQHEPQTPEEHQLYLTQVRTLGKLAGQYRLLTRDTDVDEMHDQLELLQEAEAVRSGHR